MNDANEYVKVFQQQMVHYFKQLGSRICPDSERTYIVLMVDNMMIVSSDWRNDKTFRDVVENDLIAELFNEKLSELITDIEQFLNEVIPASEPITLKDVHYTYHEKETIINYVISLNRNIKHVLQEKKSLEQKDSNHNVFEHVETRLNDIETMWNGLTVHTRLLEDFISYKGLDQELTEYKEKTLSEINAMMLRESFTIVENDKTKK